MCRKLEVPPRVSTSTEVLLLPALKDNVVSLIGLNMLQSERKRGRSADDLACRVVLGAMAGAHELVLCLIPRHDATQMGANGVERVVLEVGLVVGDNEVGGIAAETLDELARAGKMGFDVLLLPNGVAERVLRDRASGAASFGFGHEEVGKWTQNAQSDSRGRPE